MQNNILRNSKPIEVDGVALERISPDLEEWQSSSSLSGYGTPTYHGCSI